MAFWTDLISTYRGDANRSPSIKVATLAQWMLESARGTSELAIEHCNGAGLQYRARMQAYAAPVDYRGSDGILATYCHFSDAESFIRGYWHFIESGPYDGYQHFHDDGAGYIRHIAQCGYSADPNYVSNVLRLFGEAKQLLEGGEESEPAADMKGAIRLAIVVGHNSAAPGASAVAPLSTTEFAFNSRVAHAMKKEALHYNMAAEVFFREPNSSFGAEIHEVYAKVVAWRANCSIELHFNASDNTNASRSEVLYRRDSEDARELALSCVSAIVSSLKLKNGGAVAIDRGDRGGASVFAVENVPAVLVEPFFGSNSEDCLRVATLGERALALAYLRGVRDWFVAKVA